MHGNDQPEPDLKRHLAGLVAEHLLGYQRARPAAQQLNPVQELFRGAPAAMPGLLFVLAIKDERHDTGHGINKQRHPGDAGEQQAQRASQRHRAQQQ